MARLRLVGSPWIRRAETPIAGISGSLGEPTGEVIASIISTENQTDLGYEPPPGVFEGATRHGIDRSCTGYSDQREVLAPDCPGTGGRGSRRSISPISRRTSERAELPDAYECGCEGGARNGRPATTRPSSSWGVTTGTFICTALPPEVLRGTRIRHRSRDLAEASRRHWRIAGSAVRRRPVPRSAAGDPNAYVICDGPYLVQLADPGINPPNLAAVQEVSAGIYRLAGSPAGPDAELWVDDIRLSGPGIGGGHRDGGGYPLHRVRRRQRERLVHSPGRAVSSDQQRSDLSDHRRICAGHQLAARPVPAHRRSVCPFLSASPTTGPT